jgi:superoxide dismutase
MRGPGGRETLRRAGTDDRRVDDAHAPPCHHGAYVTALNAALAGTGWEDRPIEATLAQLDRLPPERCADYLEAWWNLVDWDVVAARHAAAHSMT